MPHKLKLAELIDWLKKLNKSLSDYSETNVVDITVSVDEKEITINVLTK